jgi:hypothetical protein
MNHDPGAAQHHPQPGQPVERALRGRVVLIDTRPVEQDGKVLKAHGQAGLFRLPWK